MLRAHRFVFALLFALGVGYVLPLGYARDCDPPVVKDQLEWFDNGTVKSPTAVPNADATKYWISASAQLKAGSTYKFDPTKAPTVLVYQVKNG
ncbi:MAG: hypothetical protein K2P78_04350 [Gemmataceae bacterium]|nr:hypothetical protein [Gemmataceae bacterium]